MSYKEEQKNFEELEEERRKSSFNAKMFGGIQEASSGSVYKAPVKAISLGLEARKSLDEFNNTPFFYLFPFAIVIDFIDLIPFAGSIVTFFLKPFLFVTLWGRGRWKVKVVRFLLFFTDYAPVVNKLPWSTIGVAYVYYSLKKEKESAQLELKKSEEIVFA